MMIGDRVDVVRDRRGRKSEWPIAPDGRGVRRVLVLVTALNPGSGGGIRECESTLHVERVVSGPEGDVRLPVIGWPSVGSSWHRGTVRAAEMDVRHAAAVSGVEGGGHVGVVERLVRG